MSEQIVIGKDWIIMRKMSVRDYYTVEYRLNELDKKLDAMKGMIKGRNYPIKNLILNKDGSLSEKKTDKLIDDMLDGFKRFIGFDQAERAELTEEEEKLFRAYLYIAITGPGIGSGECTIGWLKGYWYKNTETFGDIVSLTDDEGRRDSQGLRLMHGIYQVQENRVEESWEAVGFSSNPDSQEEDDEWTGMGVKVTPYKKVLKTFYSECSKIKEKPVKTFDKKDWYKDDYFSEYPKECSKKANKNRWDYYLDCYIPARVAFEKRLPDVEKFKKAYDIFSELIGKLDRQQFIADVANMVDTYLFEQGISALSFRKAYGLIDNGMKKKMDHLQSEIERVRMIYEDHE